MAKSNKKFILNDETVMNSYGFYVSTEGIDLSRFEQNPVMLSNHENKNESVLGRWYGWMKEGSMLTAFPEFDTDDTKAAEVEGKVNRDFIKGATMGLLFSPEDMVYVAGKVFLQKCELAEASIIPVPSNKRALTLYMKGQEDKALTEKEVKELCLSLQEAKPENLIPQSNMKKILLSIGALLALGYKDAPSDGIEESEINQKILGLSANLETEKLKVQTLTSEKEALEAKLGVQVQTEIAGVIDQAITDGKIPANTKEAYLSMAKLDPETVKLTLAGIPTKASLGAQTHPSGSASATAGDVKTKEDFLKLSHEAQLSFKGDNPAVYAKLFVKK